MDRIVHHHHNHNTTPISNERNGIGEYENNASTSASSSRLLDDRSQHQQQQHQQHHQINLYSSRPQPPPHRQSQQQQQHQGDPSSSRRKDPRHPRSPPPPPPNAPRTHSSNSLLSQEGSGSASTSTSTVTGLVEGMKGVVSVGGGGGGGGGGARRSGGTDGRTGEESSGSEFDMGGGGGEGEGMGMGIGIGSMEGYSMNGHHHQDSSYSNQKANGNGRTNGTNHLSGGGVGAGVGKREGGTAGGRGSISFSTDGDTGGGEGMSLSKSTNKKDKDKGKGSEKDKEKEKEKPARSCDVCRQRKVKCVRPTDLDSLSGPSSSSKCQGCHQLDIECTYKHVARKPGRPNSFASKRASESASAESNSDRVQANTTTNNKQPRGTGGNYQSGSSSQYNQNNGGGNSRNRQSYSSQTQSSSQQQNHSAGMTGYPRTETDLALQSAMKSVPSMVGDEDGMDMDMDMDLGGGFNTALHDPGPSSSTSVNRHSSFSHNNNPHQHNHTPHPHPSTMTATAASASGTGPTLPLPPSSTFSQPQLPSPAGFGSTNNSSQWYAPSPGKLFGQHIPYGTGLSPPMIKDGPSFGGSTGGLGKSLGMLDSIFDSPSSTGSLGQHGGGGGGTGATPLSQGYGMTPGPAGGGVAGHGIGNSNTTGIQSGGMGSSGDMIDYGESARSGGGGGGGEMFGDGNAGLGDHSSRWHEGERHSGFTPGPETTGSGGGSGGVGGGNGTTLAPLGGAATHHVSFASRSDIVPLGRIVSHEISQGGSGGGPSSGGGQYTLPNMLPQQSSLSSAGLGGNEAGPSSGNNAHPDRTGGSISAASGNSVTPIPSLQHNHHPFKHIQVEDVASWATVSFFVSLYLRHFHCLVPLVHVPTFTHAIAMRQDREDVDFRAFLLSLVCYLVSQSPKSRMIEHFSQAELERLQSRCHRASRLLQSRSYKVPTLTHILTLMFDYFYSASAGKSAQGMAVLSEAISLAYVMGLNDDERTASLGLDDVEVQMRRRTFWLLYAIDVTEASAGSPLRMHEFEGVCSYPEEVDDDLITSAGLFRQPPARTSLIVGFVTIMRLFRIFADCLIRHRSFVRLPNNNNTGNGIAGMGINTHHRMDTVRESLEWINIAQKRIQAILDGLPAPLQGPDNVDLQKPVDMLNAEIFGTERANILITAASVRFSLYDFKSVLNAGGGAEEQEMVSRSMYDLLASIPLDHLAANGESMRGKVLRIIAALLARSNTPGEELSSSVKDWWDMFSLIQYVMVIPKALESRLPSREPSPSARAGLD